MAQHSFMVCGHWALPVSSSSWDLGCSLIVDAHWLSFFTKVHAQVCWEENGLKVQLRVEAGPSLRGRTLVLHYSVFSNCPILVESAQIVASCLSVSLNTF